MCGIGWFPLQASWFRVIRIDAMNTESWKFPNIRICQSFSQLWNSDQCSNQQKTRFNLYKLQLKYLLYGLWFSQGRRFVFLLKIMHKKVDPTIRHYKFIIDVSRVKDTDMEWPLALYWRRYLFYFFSFYFLFFFKAVMLCHIYFLVS